MDRQNSKPTTPPVIPVSVQAAKLGNIDIHLDSLGTVTPVYTVTATSRVAGELTEVRYKEGQMVKKNELLAVIDPRPYQAVLTQGQGQLAARPSWRSRMQRLGPVRYQNSLRSTRSRSSNLPHSKRSWNRTKVL